MSQNRCLPCLTMEAEPASETVPFIKKIRRYRKSKKKIISVNNIHNLTHSGAHPQNHENHPLMTHPVSQAYTELQRTFFTFLWISSVATIHDSTQITRFFIPQHSQTHTVGHVRHKLPESKDEEEYRFTHASGNYQPKWYNALLADWRQLSRVISRI